MILSLCLFLAGLLAASALHKVLARVRLAPVAARLARSTPALGMPLLLAAAAFEGLTALALLIGELHMVGAVAAAALWLGYGLALAGRLGETLDCGCDLFSHERPVELFTVARPLLLAALSGVLAMVPPGLFAPETPFAALGLLALWFAAGELAALPYLEKVSRR